MKSWQWVVAIALGVCLLFGTMLVGVGAIYRSSLKPVTSETAEPELVEIETGKSSRQIAQLLEERGLIKNAWSFQWYLYKNGISNQIQAGLYRFSPQQPASEIADMLGRGDTAVRTITITGGMRLSQIIEEFRQVGYSQFDIDKALAESYNYSVLIDKPPEASLEGYLFPDTYRAEENMSPTQLVDLILANTERKVTTELRSGWATKGLNIHQGLTLASIVQKEVSIPEDQRQVAQVFLKRLGIGRKLEADPTYQYAAYLLGTEPSIYIDSPYNTYLYGGLPPTPIANAEAPAMSAVANPAATDWLYFLSDKEGNTHFSTTEEEHKRFIEKYLQ